MEAVHKCFVSAALHHSRSKEKYMAIDLIRGTIFDYVIHFRLLTKEDLVHSITRSPLIVLQRDEVSYLKLILVLQ